MRKFAWAGACGSSRAAGQPAGTSDKARKQPTSHMMAIHKRFPLILFAWALPLFMVSCGPSRPETGDNTLSVSIPPLQYFVDRLTDGAIDVNVMVPTGAGHATYAPTTEQIRRLSDSGLYLRIGYLGYEKSWIGRLRELNPDMQVVNLSDHTELIRGPEVQHGDHVHEGGIDPHIWMSPAVVKALLPVIRDALTEAFPEHGEVIASNHPALAAEVEAIDRAFRDLSGGLSQRSFMIFHPALTYLARDYGLVQHAIEYDGKEPSPAMLGRLIRLAREEAVSVIFIQEEYDMRSAALIREETGARLVQINPMGYDWSASMHHLLDIFSGLQP
jgi:zinc transport system substrate-binding protein